MNSDRAMLWTVAVAASLGLHALVIVALLGFGAFTGSSSPSSQPEPTAKPAAVAADSGTVPKETPPTHPTVAGTVPSAVAGTVPNETPVADSGTVPSEDKYYIVKSGDNLSKIAKLDDSSLAELAELNGKSIKELSKLMVGQKIKVKNGIK
jgi:LysM repeat protein